MNNHPIKDRLGNNYLLIVDELRVGVKSAFEEKRLTPFLKEIATRYEVGSENTIRKIIKAEKIVYRPKKTAKRANLVSNCYSDTIVMELYYYYKNHVGKKALTATTNHFKDKEGYPKSESAVRRAISSAREKFDLPLKDASDSYRRYLGNIQYG